MAPRDAGDRSELDFGAKKARAGRYIMARSCSFQNGHYKNAANDFNCLFPAVGCIIFSIYDFYICFFYIERGMLFYCIIPCTLAGLMSRADPANAITWKNLSPVSRNPGTAIPGSRLTGRLSCNCEVDFCCV